MQSQLRECGTQQQGVLGNRMTPQDEILCQLTGNGRTDRLLTYGIDVAGASASALGRKPTRIEAIRMASEANAEVHEMKERMVAMEQTCAQMAEQMAKMMSMMMSSINPTDPTNNLPNVVSSPSKLLGLEMLDFSYTQVQYCYGFLNFTPVLILNRFIYIPTHPKRKKILFWNSLSFFDGFQTQFLVGVVQNSIQTAQTDQSNLIQSNFDLIW